MTRLPKEGHRLIRVRAWYVYAPYPAKGEIKLLVHHCCEVENGESVDRQGNPKETSPFVIVALHSVGTTFGAKVYEEVRFALSSCANTRRNTLPTIDLGKPSRNSTCFGTL
jgi:hypothetical protein